MKRPNLYQEAVKNIPKDVIKTTDLSFAIADRIYRALKECGMSQKAFAKQMGKTEAEVSLWLSGQHNFTIKTIAKISVALGIDVITVQ